MIKELVKKNRSYRRFYQEKKLTRQQLMELVETARLTPSAANRQPFKYRIVCDEEENEKVFRLLGFAGCFFGNVKRDELKTQLNIPSELKIVYVIAFGYPKEEVVLEDIPADGDIKYYRDENQVHHVPKKRIEDIVL